MGMQQFPNEAAQIAAAQQAAQPDPSIWESFSGPIGRGAVTALEALNYPFEQLKQYVLAPAVERSTQSFPVRWEPGPGAFNFKLNTDAWVTPEGKFDPKAAIYAARGIPTNPFQAFGDLSNLPGLVKGDIDIGSFLQSRTGDAIVAAPGTLRYQNIQEEVARREKELGRPLSAVETRQAGEDLYKLPPYMRGTLEEAIYLRAPQAVAMRAGLAAARGSRLLRPASEIRKLQEAAGRHGYLAREGIVPTVTGREISKISPAASTAARGALRAGEAALKPVELLERGTAAAIKLPFKGIGLAGRKAASELLDLGETRDLRNRLTATASEDIAKGSDIDTVVQRTNREYEKFTNVADQWIADKNKMTLASNPAAKTPRFGTRIAKDALEADKIAQSQVDEATPPIQPEPDVTPTPLTDELGSTGLHDFSPELRATNDATIRSLQKLLEVPDESLYRRSVAARTIDNTPLIEQSMRRDMKGNPGLLRERIQYKLDKLAEFQLMDDRTRVPGGMQPAAIAAFSKRRELLESLLAEPNESERFFNALRASETGEIRQFETYIRDLANRDDLLTKRLREELVEVANELDSLPELPQLSVSQQADLDAAYARKTAREAEPPVGAEPPVEAEAPRQLNLPLDFSGPSNIDVDVVENAIVSNKLFNPFRKAKQTSTEILDSLASISSDLRGRYPYLERLNTGNAADDVIRFQHNLWDNQILLRNFADNFWRSKKLPTDYKFVAGGWGDVVTKARLSAGAQLKALTFYGKYIKKLGVAASKGVDRIDVDRFLMAKRAQYMYDDPEGPWARAIAEKKDPRKNLVFGDYREAKRVEVTNPVITEWTGRKVKPDYRLNPDDSWKILDPDSALYKKYVDLDADGNVINRERLDAFLDIVEDSRDIMRQSRRRQYDKGVTGREFFTKYDLEDDEIADLARQFEGEKLTQKITLESEIRDPWYMPIGYIERVEDTKLGLRPGTRGYGLSTNGVYDFADDFDQLTVKAPTGEIMVTHLIADEMRAANNELMNELFDMGLFMNREGVPDDIGGYNLVDVSDKYVTHEIANRHVFDAIADIRANPKVEDTVSIDPRRIQDHLRTMRDIRVGRNEIDDRIDSLLKTKKIIREGRGVEIKEGATPPKAKNLITKEEKFDLYSEKDRSGLISFYRGGKYGDGRRIILAADKEGNPVDKLLWDTLYGRGGLATQGSGVDGSIRKVVAFSNGFFKGALTTYNPLFIVKNMMIDMFTGAIGSGVAPVGKNSSLSRLAESVIDIAMNKERRYVDMQAGVGGVQTRIFSPVPSDYRNIVRAVDDAKLAAPETHKGAKVVRSSKEIESVLTDMGKDMMGIKNSTWTSRVVGGAKVWKSVPALGAMAEQSVRHRVDQKAFLKLVGKKEYDRLFGTGDNALKPEQWERELLHEWTPHFDPDGNAIANPVAKTVRRGDSQVSVGLIDSPEAAAAAMNGINSTLDFNRGGDMIKYLNNYVLFLNAAMEGTKQPLRLMGLNVQPNIRLRKDWKPGEARYEFFKPNEGLRLGYFGGKRGVSGTVADIGRGSFGMGGAVGANVRIASALTAYTYIQMVWNKQWEYQGVPLYYDIPEYVRNNAIVIMGPPPKDEDGNYIMDPSTGRPTLNYVVIPHNLREWNMLFQPINFTIDELRNDVPADLSRFALDWYKSQSPTGEGIPYPEVFRYLKELYTGEDDFRKKPIVTPGLENLEPTQQYSEYTSESAIRLAQASYDSPLPQWIKNRISSPQKSEHFFTGITGGLGKEMLTSSDYAIGMLDAFRGRESRPMQEQVAEYREMDKVSRREYIAGLNETQHKEFQKELRRPRKEIPFFEKLKDTYLRDRTGGMRQVAGDVTAERFPEISIEDTREAGRIVRGVNDKLRYDQQGFDARLSNWQKGSTTNAMNPDDWKAERSKKREQSQGSIESLKILFPKSIYNMSDEVRDDYYNSLYTAAGIDTRNGSELLVAGYYAIEPANEDPSSTDWSKFFAERDKYMQAIKTASESAGDDVYVNFMRALQGSMTATEKSYDNARRYLSTYWGLGRDVSTLTRNATPELQQMWDNYLNTDGRRQEAVRESNPTIKALIEQRNNLRKALVTQDWRKNGYPYMDALLVFWYGKYYNPSTPIGKAYHNRINGTGSLGFAPSSTLTPTVY